MLISTSLLLSLTVTIQVGPVTAQSPLDELFRCQSVTVPEDRNTCFTTETAKLQRATSLGELMIVDQKVAEERSAAAFGLRTPDALSSAFEVETPRQIASTLASSSQRGDGKYSFTLADGTAWIQVDSDLIRLRPRDGSSVVVKRAALGSYMLRIGTGRDIRVRRID